MASCRVRLAAFGRGLLSPLSIALEVEGLVADARCRRRSTGSIRTAKHLKNAGSNQAKLFCKLSGLKVFIVPVDTDSGKPR